MEWWKIVEEHENIRSTVGYDLISKCETIDMPSINQFLKIVCNYINICKELNK